MMNGVTVASIDDESEFVEVDPTGRYGRYNEILGKGASKTVYKGFDEYEGIEVAWNQVKLYDFLQSPQNLERLYSEIHLLKTLKHNNIIKFYTSWVDTANRNMNFVTEMFTSGTLRQYRQKHRRVSLRAIKHWCRQILKGLLYLHSHDPPVIHRDLKCDNIFVNGNQGEVKIGDLGLAAILRKSHAAHCVGTPEFMAPEVYAEDYNELVDIYAFGMCILEMVTFEYPYSECTHPAQIYKKVISGEKPDALYKVKDPEVRKFVEKCLVTASLRLSAKELLKDPFLEPADSGYDLRSFDYWLEFTNPVGPPTANYELEANEIQLFTTEEDADEHHMDISIKGRRGEDDAIFLRLRISDEEGRIRNIYFPFDIESDTAISVANEMVFELDISNQDVHKIAYMIDGEISCLVPNWRRGSSLLSHQDHENNCENCSGLSTKSKNPVPCPRHHNIHGRFEEITYQFEGSEQCDGIQSSEYQSCTEDEPGVVNKFDDDYEKEIRQELRWLKAKYEMELKEFREKQKQRNDDDDDDDLGKHFVCFSVDDGQRDTASRPCNFSSSS